MCVCVCRGRLQKLIRYIRKAAYKVSCLYKLRSCDALIIGGGELIAAGRSFFDPLLQWIRTAAKHKIPIFLFSVGVAGSFSAEQLCLLKDALGKAELIYTRDSASAEKLQKILGDASPDIHVVPDSVFSLSCPPADEGKKVLFGITGLARHNKHKIMPFQTEQEQFDYYLTEMKSRFDPEKVTVIYNDKNDKKTAEKFIAYAKEKGTNLRPLADIQNEDEYIKLISEAGTVFSPRMHACILGLIMNKEVIPVVLSEKMQTFYHTYFAPAADVKELRPPVEAAAAALKKKIINS